MLLQGLENMLFYNMGDIRPWKAVGKKCTKTFKFGFPCRADCAIIKIASLWKAMGRCICHSEAPPVAVKLDLSACGAENQSGTGVPRGTENRNAQKTQSAWEYDRTLPAPWDRGSGFPNFVRARFISAGTPDGHKSVRFCDDSPKGAIIKTSGRGGPGALRRGP